MKKILLLLSLFVLSLVSVSHSVFAQEIQEAEEYPVDVILEASEISVDNISIEDKALKSGDQVKGSFLLDNTGAMPFPEIYYRVYITGKNDAEGNPTAIYGVSHHGPLYVGANSSLYVPFVTTIPKGVAGKLGIRIEAFQKDETSLGSIEQSITVAGTESPITISTASITAGGKEYDIQEGPAFDPGAKVALNMIVPSKSKSDFTVVPHLSLINKNDAFKEIENSTLAPITLPGADLSSKHTLSITAPTEPGTYIGYVDFETEDGERLLPTLGIRFIVRGDTATISTVRSEATSVNKGDAFDLFVSYAGAPIDLTNDVFPQLGDATLNMVVYNEKNEIVARNEKAINLNTPVYDEQISFVAKKDAKTLNTSTFIVRDGKTLAYSSNRLGTSSIENLSDKNSAFDFAKALKITFLIVLILILGVIIFGIVTTKRSKTNIVAILIIMGGIAGSVVIFGTTTKGTEADTTVYPGAAITINVKPAKVYGAGYVTISGNASIAICLNKSADINGSIWFWNPVSKSLTERLEFVNKSNETGDKNIVPFKTYFSKKIQAPLAVGKYPGVVKTAVVYRNDGEFRARIFTQKSFFVNVVEQPDMCPLMAGIQFTVPVGMYVDDSGQCVPLPPPPPPPPPECTEDTWSCDDEWSACVDGTQNRSCTMTYDCPNVDTPSPAETRTCGLDVTCEADESYVEVGEDVKWSASAVGGDGDYSYEWSGSSPLNGESGEDVTVNYSSEGSKSGSVTVTSNGESATASCGSVSVGELDVTCEADESYVEVGEDVKWSASAVGGDGDYSYEWSGSSPLNGESGEDVTVNYSSEGSKSGSVTVTSNGESATASCGSVDVGDGPPCLFPSADGLSCPPPDITFTASPRLISKGGSCNLSWEVSGAELCNIEGAPIESVDPESGNQSETLQQTKFYRMTCTNGPTSASKTASCSVQDVTEQ